MNESGEREAGQNRDAQADLRTATFLRSLAETLPDFMLSINSEGKIDFANPPALQGFGYSLNEITSLSLTDLSPESSREALLSDVHKLTSPGVGGKILRSAWDRGLRKDGSEFPLEATLSSWDVGGTPRTVVIARDLERAKVAEENLRMLGKAVDQSPVIVIITDPEGKIEYVNSKFTEVTGYSSQEALGKTPRILKSWELPDSFYKRMWGTIKGGGDWRGEFHNKKKDGSYYWASATISPLKDSNGAVTNFVAIQEDVTERKAQELRLAEVNETLGTLLDSSPLAILTLDPAGAVRLWNSQAEKLFGWSAKEVLGHFIPIVPPDMIDYFRGKLGTILKAGAGGLDEVTCMKKGGARLQASVVIAPMHDLAGVTVGAALVLTDVTERKLLEEGLRESEERFRHSFEDAPIGMTMMRPDGSYIRVNRAFSEMLGYSVEELQSISFDSITYPEDLPANVELRKKLASGEVQSFTLEKRYIHKDGHTVWTILNVSSLHDAAGRRIFDLCAVQDISLRKAFESALSESEVRYRTLFEHSPIPLWEEDYSLARNELESLMGGGVGDLRAHLASRPELVRHLLQLVRVVDVNKAGLAFHRADRVEELRGLQSIVDESSCEQEAGLLAALVAGKTTYQMELRGRTLNGELRLVELLMLVPPGFENTSSKVFIAVRDVTEIKEAEEELRRSEQRYRSLFEESPISIWVEDCSGSLAYMKQLEARGVGDLEGYLRKNPEEAKVLASTTKIVDFNRATYDIYGATSKEELRKFLGERNDERIGALLKALLTFYRGGTESSSEIRDRDTGGRAIYVRVRGTLPAGGDEAWNRTLVSVIDISALKEAEAELRASEERFRLTFDRAAVGMTLSTPEGRIVRANPAFCRMLGYREDELKKMNWRDFTHADDAPLDERSAKQLLAGKTDHYHYEKRYLRKGGEPVWVRITVSLIRDEQGLPSLSVCMAEDISEAKALEAKLKGYSLELERKVQERTRQLDASHQKLLQAERLATIGTVAAQVGHDLRNPLTTINTSLFYLRNALPIEKDARVSETMTSMDRAIRHANKIIEDLLTYSRQSPIKKVRLDLEEVIRTAVESVVVPPAVRVTLRLAHGAKVAGDRSRLIRVFQNLITNAVDAMPAGGRLNITSSVTKGWVTVRVSDTGVGISKAELGKLFVPLYTTKAQGLGMGLSICRRLVEVHGGRISATSRLGRGSTFTVKLPKAPERHAKAKV